MLRRARAILAGCAGFALDERRDEALAAALEALAARLGVADGDAVLDACERSPLPGGALYLPWNMGLDHHATLSPVMYRWAAGTSNSGTSARTSRSG